MQVNACHCAKFDNVWKIAILTLEKADFVATLAEIAFA
jgi:hypothetical protein